MQFDFNALGTPEFHKRPASTITPAPSSFNMFSIEPPTLEVSTGIRPDQTRLDARRAGTR